MNTAGIGFKKGQDWQEVDGVIRLRLPVDKGTTGPNWIRRLEKNGYRVAGSSNEGESVLNSNYFEPIFDSKGVFSEMAVLKGQLFKDDQRLAKEIRAEADRRLLLKPKNGKACLIRETFSDRELKKMGLLAIIVMSDLIADADGDPYLLSSRRDNGGRLLSACYGIPDLGWDSSFGFAFDVSPQFCSQN